MDVGGLKPFKNYAIFDRQRELCWCHDAITHAVDIFNHDNDKPVTYDGLLKASGTVGGVVALLYGALRASTDITPEAFYQIYNEDEFENYVKAVAQGIAAYLPEPELDVTDDTEPGDELWPEVKTKKTKKKETSRRTSAAGSVRSKNKAIASQK